MIQQFSAIIQYIALSSQQENQCSAKTKCKISSKYLVTQHDPLSNNLVQNEYFLILFNNKIMILDEPSATQSANVMLKLKNIYQFHEIFLDCAQGMAPCNLEQNQQFQNEIDHEATEDEISNQQSRLLTDEQWVQIKDRDCIIINQIDDNIKVCSTKKKLVVCKSGDQDYASGLQNLVKELGPSIELYNMPFRNKITDQMNDATITATFATAYDVKETMKVGKLFIHKNRVSFHYDVDTFGSKNTLFEQKYIEFPKFAGTIKESFMSNDSKGNCLFLTPELGEQQNVCFDSKRQRDLVLKYIFNFQIKQKLIEIINQISKEIDCSTKELDPLNKLLKSIELVGKEFPKEQETQFKQSMEFMLKNQDGQFKLNQEQIFIDCNTANEQDNIQDPQ